MRFLKVMFGQIRELLTNYGKIDLMWFDGGWERSPEEWKAAELEKMIRELQPGIIINDRLPGCGDYVTPEQAIPATPPKGPWETCMTINNSWGYNPSDRALKSPRYLLHALCEVAGKGGNLLVNISPMGDGALPPEHLERLEVFTEWMESTSGEHHRDDRGPGALAILRTLDPAWRSHLPTSADAPLRIDLGTRRVCETREGGDGARHRREARPHFADFRHRSDVQ